MKNFRTPRTLSECEFTSGYPTMPRTERKTGNVWLNVSLAVAIGVVLTLLVVSKL